MLNEFKMDNPRRKKPIILVACLCMAAAITVFAVKSSHVSASDDAVFSDSSNFSGTTGFIHQEIGKTDGYMILNYSTLKNGYLCKTASASTFDRVPGVLAQYGGSIYALASGETNTSYIYKVGTDGKTKETLMKFDAGVGGRMIIMSGKLYYERIVQILDKSNKPTGKTTVSIDAVNLNRKTNAEVSPVRTGTNASVTIVGYYKDNLYYIYSSSKETLSSGKTVTNKHAVYALNVKTGKETATLSSAGKLTEFKFYQGNVYYILTNTATHIPTLYCYNLDTAAITTIVTDKDLITGFQCFDGKIFYRKGATTGINVPESSQKKGYCYDLKTQDTSLVPITYGTNDYLYIVSESSNLFVLIHQNSTANGQMGDASYAYIKKSDYYKSKVNFTNFK